MSFIESYLKSVLSVILFLPLLAVGHEDPDGAVPFSTNVCREVLNNDVESPFLVIKKMIDYLQSIHTQGFQQNQNNLLSIAETLSLSGRKAFVLVAIDRTADNVAMQVSHDLNLHVVTVTDYAIHFSENSIEFKNLIWHEDLSVELIFALQTIMNSKNIPFFKDMRGITRTSNHLNQADSANSTIESIEFAANQYPLLKVFPLRDEELNKLFLLLH